jgi:hypothetical protein
VYLFLVMGNGNTEEAYYWQWTHCELTAKKVNCKIKTVVFQDVTPGGLVKGYQRFQRTHC